MKVVYVSGKRQEEALRCQKRTRIKAFKCKKRTRIKSFKCKKRTSIKHSNVRQGVE